MLGLMDNVASPFAMVRLHGRELVRVEACGSTFINELYPGEITSEIDARSRDLLLSVGHTARQYNPTVRTVLGETLRGFMPRWQPESGAPFVQYTLPAIELRRLLAEARLRNEAFSVRYAVLPGAKLAMRRGAPPRRRVALSYTKTAAAGARARSSLLRASPPGSRYSAARVVPMRLRSRRRRRRGSSVCSFTRF